MAKELGPICPQHRIAWFRAGKMKSFAHPVEGSDEWCNMPTEKEGTPPAKPAPSPTNGSGTQFEARDISIQRQVALKAAQQAAEWLLANKPALAEDDLRKAYALQTAWFFRAFMKLLSGQAQIKEEE